MRNLTQMNQMMPEGPPKFSNCNVTSNMKSLKTPVGMLLQIDLLVMFTSLLLLFLVTFGSWRRRCNNNYFGTVIFMAYTLSTSTLTYTLGLMNEAPFRHSLFPIWALFLMLALLGSAHAISTYSLEDNQRWRSYNWQIQIKLIWVIVLIVLYCLKRKGTLSAIVLLTLILFLKSDERARALMAVSRQSLQRKTRVVADYMRREHESGGVSSVEVDPVNMRGYTYLVRGEEETWVDNFVRAKRFIERCLGKEETTLAPNYRTTLDKDKLITIEKVWNCEGKLLSSGDPDNKLKDTCLSFALFKLLLLRYAGYSLPKKVHENAWKLIRNILPSQENGCSRAFRLAEVELTFLYDFFYSNYSTVFQLSWWLNKLLELTYAVMVIWATTHFLKYYHHQPYSDCQLVILPNGIGIDVLVTTVIIISFITVELIQFFYMIFSEWAKVIWICKYVRKKSWQENVIIGRMIKAICGVWLLKPWERKLRQYSFLESYFYKPSCLLNNAFMAAYMDQTRDGQRQSTPIQLPEEVKQVVFHALKRNAYNYLEKGQTLLRPNTKSEKLMWACWLETETQVIMVWHIATSFCEHQLPVRSNSPKMRRDFLVATSLSKYLAYLVAFAPWLLPDHPLFAEDEFNQAIIEAKVFFSGCKRLEDRITKMERMGNGNSVHEVKFIERGVRLGNQLKNDIKDKEMIWRILADFWVELLLYVAPSDNAKAHVEHLAKGGEFVTHLWVLLSHVGIKRNHPTKPRNALERSNSL